MWVISYGERQILKIHFMTIELLYSYFQFSDSHRPNLQIILENVSSLDMLHNHTQIYLVFCSVYWTRSENGGPVKLKNKKCSTCEIRKGFWRKRSYFEFNLPVVHLVKSAWYLRQPPHPPPQSKRLVSTSPEWKLMNTGNGKRFGLHS